MKSLDLGWLNDVDDAKDSDSSRKQQSSFEMLKSLVPEMMSPDQGMEQSSWGLDSSTQLSAPQHSLVQALPTSQDILTESGWRIPPQQHSFPSQVQGKPMHGFFVDSPTGLSLPNAGDSFQSSRTQFIDVDDDQGSTAGGSSSKEAKGSDYWAGSNIPTAVSFDFDKIGTGIGSIGTDCGEDDELSLSPIRVFEVSRSAIGRNVALSKPLFRYDGIFVTGTENPDEKANTNYVMVGILPDSSTAEPENEGSEKSLQLTSIPVRSHVRDLTWLRPQSVLLALGSRLALMHLPSHDALGAGGELSSLSCGSHNHAAPQRPDLSAVKVFDDFPQVHTDVIRQVAVSTFSNHLAISGGFDGRVCISDLSAISGASAARVVRIHETGDVVGSVSWHPSSEQLCAWTTDPGQFTLYDLRSPRVISMLTAEVDELYTHTFYDDHTVMLGFGNGEVSVVDTRKPQKVLGFWNPYVSAIGEFAITKTASGCKLASFGMNEFSVQTFEYRGNEKGMVYSQNKILGHHRPCRSRQAAASMLSCDNLDLPMLFPGDAQGSSGTFPDPNLRDGDCESSNSGGAALATAGSCEGGASSSLPLELPPPPLAPPPLSANKDGDAFSALPTAVPLAVQEAAPQALGRSEEVFYKTSGSFLAGGGCLGVTDSNGLLTMYDLSRL